MSYDIKQAWVSIARDIAIHLDVVDLMAVPGITEEETVGYIIQWFETWENTYITIPE